MKVKLCLLSFFLLSTSSYWLQAQGSGLRSFQGSQAAKTEAPSGVQKVDTPTGATNTETAKVSETVPPSVSGTVVTYGERDVLRLKTKLRYTTLIVLPKSEQVLDFTCGDKEFWIVNGNQNFAYVKPARANAQTNLNLITASGRVYSFILSEVSSVGGEPDLKVFVELKDSEAVALPPRFVAASEVEDYQQQVAMAKEEARQSKESAQAALERDLARFRSEYPTALKFSYRIDLNRKPFQVTAMYHDDRFTYIRASPQETPVLYELKDGKPNLVSFEYRNGTYIVGKILDSGYLAIGKMRMSFTRQE